MEVKRTDERVWIDGVKGFSPGEHASSPHGCQARISQAVGESITYADLICYSGFAFRIGVHEKLCPSAGPAWVQSCVRRYRHHGIANISQEPVGANAAFLSGAARGPPSYFAQPILVSIQSEFIYKLWNRLARNIIRKNFIVKQILLRCMIQAQKHSTKNYQHKKNHHAPCTYIHA